MIIIISMAPEVIIIIIITVIIVIITIIILITIIMAPEVVNYEDISLATDQWSLGVLCFILLSGEITPAGLQCDRPYLQILKTMFMIKMMIMIIMMTIRMKVMIMIKL